VVLVPVLVMAAGQLAQLSPLGEKSE
jgi:hypothetical protein